MPKIVEPLTALKCTIAKFSLKSGGKNKIFDGGMLYLHLTEGGKNWRVRYQCQSEANVFSIGPFPAVSLRDARAKRLEVERSLLCGVDPNASKIALLFFREND